MNTITIDDIEVHVQRAAKYFDVCKKLLTSAQQSDVAEALDHYVQIFPALGDDVSLSALAYVLENTTKEFHRTAVKILVDWMKKHDVVRLEAV